MELVNKMIGHMGASYVCCEEALLEMLNRLAAKTMNNVRAAIEEVHSVADLVVFSIHWGPNMREKPTKAFRGIWSIS